MRQSPFLLTAALLSAATLAGCGGGDKDHSARHEAARKKAGRDQQGMTPPAVQPGFGVGTRDRDNDGLTDDQSARCSSPTRSPRPTPRRPTRRGANAFIDALNAKQDAGEAVVAVWPEIKT